MAIIIGGPLPEVLIGDPLGVAEDDIIFGNGSDDRIDGLARNDLLFGGMGMDFIEGGDGNDTVEGGMDADIMDGGAGKDTLSYAQAVGSVAASLDTGTGVLGDAAGDVFRRFENLAGSGFDDRLIGSKSKNEIIGGAGDDFLDGLSGNDTLRGDAGADTMVGGAKKDTFTYFDLTDSPAIAGAQDLIVDFTLGDDLIDFTGIDDTNAALLPFLGHNVLFTGAAGEFRSEDNGASTIIEIDADGDTVADLRIDVVGVVVFTAADFIF